MIDQAETSSTRTADIPSSGPWLPGWAPRPGRLARARLRSQADVPVIEKVTGPRICCLRRRSSTASPREPPCIRTSPR